MWGSSIHPLSSRKASPAVIVISMDGGCLGSPDKVAKVALAVKAMTERPESANKHIIIVPESIIFPYYSKTTADRIVETAIPAARTLHTSKRPATVQNYNVTLNTLERDHIQLLRRSVHYVTNPAAPPNQTQRKTILESEDEIVVRVCRIREFIGAMQILGECTNKARQTLVSEASHMGGLVLLAALAANGIAADHVKIDPNSSDFNDAILTPMANIAMRKFSDGTETYTEVLRLATRHLASLLNLDQLDQFPSDSTRTTVVSGAFGSSIASTPPPAIFQGPHLASLITRAGIEFSLLCSPSHAQLHLWSPTIHALHTLDPRGRTPTQRIEQLNLASALLLVSALSSGRSSRDKSDAIDGRNQKQEKEDRVLATDECLSQVWTGCLARAADTHQIDVAVWLCGLEEISKFWTSTAGGAEKRPGTWIPLSFGSRLSEELSVTETVDEDASAATLVAIVKRSGYYCVRIEQPRASTVLDHPSSSHKPSSLLESAGSLAQDVCQVLQAEGIVPRVFVGGRESVIVVFPPLESVALVSSNDEDTDIQQRSKHNDAERLAKHLDDYGYLVDIVGWDLTVEASIWDVPIGASIGSTMTRATVEGLNAVSSRYPDATVCAVVVTQSHVDQPHPSLKSRSSVMASIAYSASSENSPKRHRKGPVIMQF